MNSLKAAGISVTLPPDVIIELAGRVASSWSGALTLNFKEGEILSFEVTEKRRVVRETHVSRVPKERNNSHGPELSD